MTNIAQSYRPFLGMTSSARSVSLWQHPPRELRLLLWSLTSENQEEPVRSWIFEHVERIQRLDPILTGISPESAIAVLRRGGFIDLAGHNKSDWGQPQWALARVAEMDVPRRTRNTGVKPGTHSREGSQTWNVST